MQLVKSPLLRDIEKLTSRYLADVINNISDWWNNHDAGRMAWNYVKTDALITTTISVSSDTTLDSTSQTVLVDASSNAVTLTLPTASSFSGQRFQIKVTAGTNIVTLDGSGSETIEGNAQFYLPGEGFSVEIVSDGTNWRTV